MPSIEKFKQFEKFARLPNVKLPSCPQWKTANAIETDVILFLRCTAKNGLSSTTSWGALYCESPKLTVARSKYPPHAKVTHRVRWTPGDVSGLDTWLISPGNLVMQNISSSLHYTASNLKFGATTTSDDVNIRSDFDR